MHYYNKLRLSALSAQSLRAIHTTHAAGASGQVQRFKVKPKRGTRLPVSAPETWDELEDDKQEGPSRVPQMPKRNAAGVQLLTPSLHKQIFRDTRFPAPSLQSTNIALSHLRAQKLYPEQASVLPETDFTLPALQGSNLLEHFHNIGAEAAEPYLSMARAFAAKEKEEFSPMPSFEDWETQRSGWTKYVYMPDGSSYCEAVPFPMDPDTGAPEDVLSFDVETLPNYHPYPIIACALSKSGWYSWISPWLLGETEDPEHLVPLGPKTGDDMHRIVVGHNVSYDRARIEGEYSLHDTKTRFLDTMSMHVAVKGISSHQRPHWMKYRKSKDKERTQQEEAIVVVQELLEKLRKRMEKEKDEAVMAELITAEKAMQDTLDRQNNQLDSGVEGAASDDLAVSEDNDIAQQRWEDITSANSLLDVYSLYYPSATPLNKETRKDLLKLTREDILGSLNVYMEYCASDVWATHRVYSKVLPAFLNACPHPVSFAGILTMGSSILTVDQGWDEYIARAEGVYSEMKQGIRDKLIELAEQARCLASPPTGLESSEEDPEPWADDPWLSQLDWTPKTVGVNRGVVLEAPQPAQVVETTVPKWFLDFDSDPFGKGVMNRIVPALLELSYDGHDLRYSSSQGWHYLLDDGSVQRPGGGSSKIGTILSKRYFKAWIKAGKLGSPHLDLAMSIVEGDTGSEAEKQLRDLALEFLASGETASTHSSSLDWTPKHLDADGQLVSKTPPRKPKSTVFWPKWYWELTKPKKDAPPGTVDVTVRNRVAPILLRLSWFGYPLFYSKEHGWTFRVLPQPKVARQGEGEGESKGESESKGEGEGLVPEEYPGVDLSSYKLLNFYDPADEALSNAVLKGGYRFYKLPHKDGEKANVGSPLSKGFMKYADDGTLGSESGGAKEALEMNAKCSYWISARDRIMNQMVLWEDKGKGKDFGFPKEEGVGSGGKWGVILPQVLTMGTVTRRAIEKTWLTASNAKKNRVGSELKAMIRAPPGYSIVGADVDSEELWISSCMGDAQFGMHGATAIGWMTLEGTKSNGTDLHSKTASILGISRDQAKVFNYSRIYGAGQKHAVLLLMQDNPSMKADQAKRLAATLYSSTKGQNTHSMDMFGRKFWFGGTESFLFNKLEQIATSQRPQTPALSCGITSALSKEYLPSEDRSDYLPSRINWVVQSSGVDYLHLLIVSMQHLIDKYDIDARYLISVHDELRYLVKDQDRYRAALALQIANLWTRCMFAMRLGMDNLPQGVAFFSAVDVDKVLRKEVDMPCVTPSQPTPIPPGESLDILKVLEKTGGGSLMKDGGKMEEKAWAKPASKQFSSLSECLSHRASSVFFLKAQSTSSFTDVKRLSQIVDRRTAIGGQGASTGVAGGSGGASKRSSKNRKELKKKIAPLGNGEGYDWTEVIERYGIQQQRL